MDVNKVIGMTILALVIALAAVVTYFILVKVVAPPTTLHRGTTIITLPLGIGSYQVNIIAWPPYFQLLNASSIYKLFTNYSLVYGPNTAPIKVLIIYNPIMPPGTNFTLSNINYMLNSTKSGLVQYEIAFNLFSFMGTGSSPMTLAETNVASVAYCLYYNSTNKDNALLFLREVASYVGSNATKVASLTSTTLIQNMLNQMSINMNVTNCVNKYENIITKYQTSVGVILNAYYVQPFYTQAPLGTSSVNSPVVFILGYNSVSGAYDDTYTPTQLSTFVNNLATQRFMYQNING
ncbi:MAG: hypothetical protein TU36_001815 [Vulcanisaeta sp. AZ3]|jgi:hypothetical protein|nr:MAG: hypothetical protein TU36_03550 [Vulcanisaeta sp. AZ3]